MPLKQCAVTFWNEEDAGHTVTVTAESLNEAVLLARSVLLKDPLCAGVPWGFVEVEGMEPKVIHRVNLMTALAWMNCRSESPRLMALKSRLQQLQNVAPAGHSEAPGGA